MATESQIGGGQLEKELAALLDVERFPPPREFAEQALLSDPEVYERAAADPLGWWAEQARALHWFEPFQTVLDDSEAPFYKWFEDGRLNASYNCLDRHVEAGIGDRVALHPRGGEGGERGNHHAELLAAGQRLAS